MKKNVLLLLMMAAIAITGCKKEEEQEEEPKSSIVGKWFVKKLYFVRYEGSVKKEEETETDFGNSDYYEFKADGTGTFSEVGDTDPLTYTVAGDVITITDNPGESFSLKIKSLAANDAVLVEESTETNQGITYRNVMEITLKK